MAGAMYDLSAPSLVWLILFYVVVRLPVARIGLSVSIIPVSPEFLLRIEPLLANVTRVLTSRILTHGELLNS
jgi:hypothetical protein